MFMEDLQCRCLRGVTGFKVVFRIEIPGIYNQDQKYNNENTQIVTEIMK
jgi:hypothetical protein